MIARLITRAAEGRAAIKNNPTPFWEAVAMLAFAFVLPLWVLA